MTEHSGENAAVSRAEFDLLCQVVECLMVQPYMPLSNDGPYPPNTRDILHLWAKYRTVGPAALGLDHEPDNPRGVWCCDEHQAEFRSRQSSPADRGTE